MVKRKEGIKIYGCLIKEILQYYINKFNRPSGLNGQKYENGC